MADPHLHEIRACAGRSVPEREAEKIRVWDASRKAKCAAFTEDGYHLPMLAMICSPCSIAQLTTLHLVDICQKACAISLKRI